MARRHIEVGKVRRLEVEFHIDHFRNAHRVVERFGNVLETRIHFVRALQIEVRAVVKRRVLNRGVGADGDQNLVHFLVLRAQIMRVVGDDERNAGFVMNRDQLFVDFVLAVKIVIHHLEEEVFRPENLAVFLSACDRFLKLIARDQLRNLAAQTGASANNAFRILRDQFVVDARTIVKTVEMSARRQLDQVFVALKIFRPQREMMRVFLLVQMRVFVGVFTRRDVGFHADYGLNAFGFARFVKVNRAIHHAVIGDREGGHIHFRSAFRQVFNAIGAVEQRVLGVNVKVTETAGTFAHGSDVTTKNYDVDIRL